MVIIKAVFRNFNNRNQQVKFICPGNSLGDKRHAETFSQAQAEAKIDQLKKEERFKTFDFSIENAIIEEVN
ncbi:hypothetical protein [Herpetosiphon geysericola]|uniref:Uncharacterized protein n=1 Tax=Herpetosiphon geysericola TaxID=70996 RepID=A0A0P6YHP0_9CHLR|nr:hypothetical protein [Herpetosiphon geysericola]KPL89975.1 hypothetical protein SE18_08430 [Herpetosiphon geysericola]